MKHRIFALAVAALVAWVAHPALAQMAPSPAIADATAALEKDPGNQDLRIQLVNLYYREGIEDLTNNLPEDAVQTLEKGLEEGQSGPNPLPDTESVIQLVRYAIGYGYYQQGLLFEAILVLDELVAWAPDMTNAKYMLGVALMRTMTNENIQRGMDILKEVADDAADAEGRNIATGSGVRLAYNISTTEFAGGEAENARDLLNLIFAKFGSRAGADELENAHLNYAAGYYLMETGDLDGAQFELDFLDLRVDGAVKKGDLPGAYTLKNGVTLDQVRAQLYYRAALARLQEGDEAGGNGALDMLDMLEEIEGQVGTDVMHARALAMSAAGDDEGMKAQMEALEAADPAYYNSVIQ